MIRIIKYCLIIIISACTTTRYVDKIRIDTIKVASPIIEDTLKAKIITDTVVITNKITKKDTIIDVRYYPVEKKFYIKVKPDSITIFKIDTVTQIKEKKDYNINKIFWIILMITGIIIIIKLQNRS